MKANCKEVYKIEITEILQREYSIVADSADDACRLVKELYNNCDIILNADDFVEVTFSCKD
ncbi:MAG: DpnD/PcfM family protein [Phascolarctobacterium sp.]|nr:DpnD/PcfM family protein [Phascolarctobacterium sp.]